jgi:hypothetical protein
VPSRFTFQWDEQVINTVVRGQNGIAGREVRRRGELIKLRAQELVGVDTGRLRASIYVRNFTILGNPAVVIGFGTRYGQFHHNGTGLWGPFHRRITPKTAGALVFKPKGSSRTVFAASVRGSKPNPFLRDAIVAGADPDRRGRVEAALNASAPAWVGNVHAGRNAAQIGDHDWRRNVSGGASASGRSSGGWDRNLSGGAPASGRSSGSTSGSNWTQGVSGGRRPVRRTTGWTRHVGPGARTRRGR